MVAPGVSLHWVGLHLGHVVPLATSLGGRPSWVLRDAAVLVFACWRGVARPNPLEGWLSMGIPLLVCLREAQSVSQ